MTPEFDTGSSAQLGYLSGGCRPEHRRLLHRRPPARECRADHAQSFIGQCWRTGLRAIILLAALKLGAVLLPVVPAAGAALLCVILGAVAMVSDAVAAAVRQGHLLAPLDDHRALRRLLGGASRRTVGGLAVWTAGGALSLIALAQGDAGTWLVATATIVLTLVLSPLVQRRVRREATRIHADQFARHWTRAIVCLLVFALCAAVAVTGSLPDPVQPTPSAASALVAEAFEWHWIAIAAIYYAAGLAPAFLDWHWEAATALVLLWEGAFVVTISSLALALTLPRGDCRRVFGRASDSMIVPEADRIGMAAGAVFIVGWMAVATWTDGKLRAIGPEHWPSRIVLQFVEQIGDEFFRLGTLEADADLSSRALKADAAQVAELRSAANKGFDGMEANVDLFLDGYYSLPAEYLRMWKWASGGLQEHLRRQLLEALRQGDPFSDYQSALDRARSAGERLASDRADLLAANRVEQANPALIRPIAPPTSLPGPPELRSVGMGTGIEGRLAVSAGAGLLSAHIAQRLAARIAQRGILTVSARALSKISGFLGAFGVDYALLKLEESVTRDALRAEIVAELNRLRADALGDH